jgi:dolichol-phosphate mannosyltransferase
MPESSSRPERVAPAVSVVVPVRNEADNVGPLAEEIAAAMNGRWSF